MPVEQRSSGRQLTTIAGILLMVALGVLTVVGLISMGRSRNPTAPTATSEGGRFRAGVAESLMQTIAEEGPILLPDVSGRGQQRPLLISHSGDDPRRGWVVVSAHPPGTPADCFVKPDEDQPNRWEAFDADDSPCGRGPYPADGSGLTVFPWQVNAAGSLLVDLSPPTGTTTTLGTRTTETGSRPGTGG